MSKINVTILIAHQHQSLRDCG